MSPDAPSNVRVFVHWRDQTVFAGEEVRCTISFKNVAQQPPPPPPATERQRLVSPLQGRAGGHRRSALSLSVPSPGPHSRSGSIQWPHTLGSGDRHAHKRSVSIVSIGSAIGPDDLGARGDPGPKPQRPHRGHGRAASLQILPRAQSSAVSGPQSASLQQSSVSPTMLHASYPPDRFGRISGVSTIPNTPSRSWLRRSPLASPRAMPDFQFPPAALPRAEPQDMAKRPAGQPLLSPQDGLTDHGNPSHRLKEQPHTPNDGPSVRLLSSTSGDGGTPRSSGEFYSVRNHSSETLASEYVTQPLARGNNGRQPPMRRPLATSPHQTRAPESLMMGYAQIQGSFTLDGSLISLGPFEQVKKKAAVGGRRGGVVGLEPSKRETGILGGFGWGSISNTLGDLWGGAELSTVKEMRGIASSRSVPLLSTPQSILFVDLHLAPGDSRAFEYSFRLPKGLPPTHKGKAAKFSYSLVIGTQRAGGVKEQQVRSVEVPFRVLGSVNGHGEILGHDLMNPYVLLRDDAEVTSLEKVEEARRKAPGDSKATGHEFAAYVDELLAGRRDAGGGILSPTEASDAKRSPALEEATSAQDAIRLAILRSNMAAEGQQSANRFEIARNGQRVGVVMLARPAYRLGEVVTMVIDFSDADVACYAVHMTLETSETVDAALATRSESSIQRVTRKVYAASSEATLHSRRVVFSPAIPMTATPEFVTSSISLQWKIRVEFVVPHQGSQASQVPHPLLEQTSQDEKGGLVLVAVESLACESFDVSVPLRVYGATGRGLERGEISEEGLPV